MVTESASDILNSYHIFFFTQYTDIYICAVQIIEAEMFVIKKLIINIFEQLFCTTI